MAPNPRVREAFRAMKAIGISEIQVKPVLKRLLKLYDKKWELIEEENYRVLADAIFEDDDPKGENFEEAEVHDEPEQPLKRSRSRSQDGQHSSYSDNSNPTTDGMPLKKPKVEENVSRPMSSQDRRAYKGKQPMLPQVSPREKRPMHERPSHVLRIKENAVNTNVVQVPKKKLPDTLSFIIPKDEPFTDDTPHYEAPIRMIMPDSSSKENNSVRSVPFGNSDDQEPPASHIGAEENEDDNVPVKSGVNSQLTAVPEDSPANMEIASSSLGEVKIYLSCNSLLGRPNFHMPGQDELLKSMQEKCLRSYKNFDPNFSIMQMLNDMCECFLELATDSSHESQERLVNVTPLIDVLKKPAACSALGGGGIGGKDCLPGNISNGSLEASALQIPRQLQYFVEDMHPVVNGTVETDGVMELSEPESRSLVVVPQHQLTSEDLRSLYDFNDLTKGEETVQISWLNEINNECPPSFHYMPGNLIFQNAFVNFTLSQIKAEGCCSTCVRDCLSSTTICVCASNTYASDGLLREDFLDDCIAMTRDPQQQCLSYCRACPLERSKNDGILEPCKGHLKRRYIKECWRKCSCHKQCVNRVVQRGIRHKLQVFFTPEGKGWGLRTLEKLPKGTFICEYVGEILTNKELHERNMQRMRSTNGRHTYPVVLDAYWFLKGVLKDEEALCLDATFFGNVARFINHRCLDANLIEIPVKIETPDDHYYHLAFFTTREVDALEELNWDYGIDFDDNDQPVEVFRCLCGSKFCRNMKRSNRSRSLSR
ncbi:probable inactive histone-lysine N-methyltransferase SUVR2 isoform X2 [Euphorbia lathyris]|uniref:probable inactive histone-lysine N-methyltransferase SUVR2 isoform X2 n=1 Tax=Euphorbia lathyris TaxID=212925 RepID=UPI0033131897